MAEQFAQEFFWSEGCEVLFAVHTDHIHAHFLMSNGTSFRRDLKELVEMSKYFREQCMEYSFYNSVRDSFYSPNKNREKIIFAEHQMKKRGKLSLKDEIKVCIRWVMSYECTKMVQDVHFSII